MIRTAIAFMIFAAATAQGAYREGAKRVEDGHDSYEVIQYRNSNGIRPEGLLWFGPSVPRAYEEVISTYTNELDEVESVTNQVPVPHSLCKWLDGDHAPTARTEAEIAAIEAEAAQDEAQRIGRLAQQHGAKIGMLANLLSVYGLQIPTSKAEVVAKIESLVAAGTLTAEQTGAIGTIDAVYGIIEATKDENGQSIKDDVAAIWEAMQQ